MISPKQKIQAQDWMSDPATKAVMQALKAEGQAPQALFVGGCVRNALMGREVDDIDIATIHKPEDTARLLEAAGLKAVPTGIAHGTITAVSGGKAFEITTLRKDVETDGRRAVVAFTQRWEEDAQRRDFTMNTLLMDEAGGVYDPTGQGLDDLRKRKVVFVGDAGQRIAEDHLRILRFFRFYGGYGEGAPDADALKACKASAGKVHNLSKERVTQEFFKIIALDKATDTLGIMFRAGVLKDFAFAGLDLFQKFCALQEKFGLAAVPPRLFVLAALKPQNITSMQKLLLFPKVFQKDIESLDKVLGLGILESEQKIREAVYRQGRTATAQALLVQGAQGHFEENYLSAPLQQAIRWEAPNFPVTGEDLVKAGMSPGPELGAALERIENWWIADGFKASKEECLLEA